MIAGAALAAGLVPKEVAGIELLGIPTIGALAFNLWFTVNRLRSNSRIIAYVQLLHESETALAWLGWENSLRLYRIWRARCPNAVRLAESKFVRITQYDNLSFYWSILLLHITMAIAIAALMSFRAWVNPPTIPGGTLPVVLLPMLNAVAAITFMIWALVLYRPIGVYDGIEKARILWQGVFASHAKGELKELI